MKATAVSRLPAPLADTQRRVLVILFSAAAIAAGAFAASVSATWAAFVGVMLIILVVAWTIPWPWIGMLTAAVIPWQGYLTIPETSLTLRIAVVFVFAAALRLLAAGELRSVVTGRSALFAPPLVFLLAATAAAFGAFDKYGALKGVLDWGAVFATAFLIGGLPASRQTVRRMLEILIFGGVAQALLGLLEYSIGLDKVVDLLALPGIGIVIQPNLLQERLSDLSFNWVTFDRALPFGTFINGIDYAVFLAAILSLCLTFMLDKSDERTDARARGMIQLPHLNVQVPALVFLAALTIAAALLLTFKGSGILAIGGGIATPLLLSLRRVSRRAVFPALVVVVALLLFALPFADLVGQRVLFLLQREQGAFGTPGRLQIWANLLQFIGERPLVGYGINNAARLMEPQWTLRMGAPALLSTTPESAYVAGLVETGIVGFAALVAWLVFAIAKGIHHTRNRLQFGLSATLVAGIVALLLGAVTISGLTTDQNGMLLGLLVGLVHWFPNND